MTAFLVNEPSVVYEAFDAEIVVVNLETGKYYSLIKTGPTIWIDLVNGISLDEIASRIQRRYTGEPAVIADAVAKFAERLVTENLLIPSVNVVARPQITPVDAAGSKMPFEAPVIENYDDMLDLLTLDPIHAVDPAGWPVMKKNS